jgi:hypothetical protein
MNSQTITGRHKQDDRVPSPGFLKKILNLRRIQEIQIGSADTHNLGPVGPKIGSDPALRS